MSTNQLKQYYENSAERFWDPKQGMVGRDLHVYPLLEGLSGRVLEYGCGAGSLLLGLAMEDRFSHCTGVDISEVALSGVARSWSEIAPDKLEKLSCVTPDEDHLPTIPDNSHDVILSLDTIEHVLDPYIVIDELHRVATKHAVFIISVPNYAYVKYRMNLLFGVQPRTGTNKPVTMWRYVGWDGMHLHTFTKSSLEVLLNNCGWEVQQWTGYGERFSNLGMGVLRRTFPGFWSGAITAVCKKVRHPVPVGSRGYSASQV